MTGGIFYLIFLLILAITPSLIWLDYYLRRDDRPEPRRWLIFTFCFGVFITIFINFLEINVIGNWQESLSNKELKIIIFFLLLPFIEEVGKFLAAFFSTIKNRFFGDETTDPIIYTITAGLGFAAAENLKVCFSILQENFVFINWYNLASLSLSSTIINTLIITIFIRFLSAVFLHATSCAIFGYFWSVGLILKKKKNIIAGLIVFGIIIASVLHSCYNYLIMKMNANLYFALGVFLLLAISNYIMSRAFKQIKSYQKNYDV